jgi:hypothetical protein
VVWTLFFAAASLFVATLVTASQTATEKDRGGAAPYTPARGEWLCLLLNSRQALASSQRAAGGVAVHYVYDASKPDTVRIEVLFGEGGSSAEQVRRCAERAEQHAIETAKVYGWQNWLKIEREERKVTDMFAADVMR